MSDFGDFDPDDAYDASGVVDPEQVAKKLGRLYDEVGAREHNLVAVRLVAWLRRQGGLQG